MNKKQNNSFIKNTISSLYEVEHFLDNYNSFSDAIAVFKLLKRHNNKKTTNMN